MALTCNVEGCDTIPDFDFDAREPGEGVRKTLHLCSECLEAVQIMLMNQIAEAERQLDQRPLPAGPVDAELDLSALPVVDIDLEALAFGQPEELEDPDPAELAWLAHLVLEQHGVQLHGEWSDESLHEAYWECDYCPKRSELYRLSLTGCLIAARRHAISEAHRARERELGHTCSCCSSPE